MNIRKYCSDNARCIADSQSRIAIISPSWALSAVLVNETCICCLCWILLLLTLLRLLRCWRYFYLSSDGLTQASIMKPKLLLIALIYLRTKKMNCSKWTFIQIPRRSISHSLASLASMHVLLTSQKQWEISYRWIFVVSVFCVYNSCLRKWETANKETTVEYNFFFSERKIYIKLVVR